MFPVCLLVCIWRCSSATELTCWFPTPFFSPLLGFMESASQAARENISLFLGSDKMKNPFFRPRSHFRIYYHDNTGESLHWFFIIGFIAGLTSPSRVHISVFRWFHSWSVKCFKERLERLRERRSCGQVSGRPVKDPPSVGSAAALPLIPLVIPSFQFLSPPVRLRPSRTYLVKTTLANWSDDNQTFCAVHGK